MKKLILIPLFLLIAAATTESFKPFDDTSTLQGILNGGNVTLASGHTYNISSPGVIVKGVVNMNHAVINYTSTTGVAVRLNTNGASITNGTVQGPWVFSMTGTSGGAIGVKILNSNQTVNNVIIKKFAGYGLLCNGFNNITVTNNSISEIGFGPVFMSADAANKSGWTFSNNVVDNSMLPASTVQSLAVAMRGGTSLGSDTVRDIIFSGNTIKMPLNPTSDLAEGAEFRYVSGGVISNNTFIQSSIPISIVRCRHFTVFNNKISSAKKEGIEYGATEYALDSLNSVNGSNNWGYLFDATSRFITMVGDTVKNATYESISMTTNTKRITVKGCVLTTLNTGINLDHSDSLTVINTIINGQSRPSTVGIKLSNSPGNINCSSGNIFNCAYQVFVSNTTTGALIDNILVHNTLHAGTINQIGSYLQNGAHLGSNIHFTTSVLVFNALPTKIYGDANFAPGAVSTNAITYASGNTGVATIVSGNIHIVGAGSANITANDGDSSITRSLTVNKATLIIAADTKYKTQGVPNPSLTASYIGFVNGETNTVLTAQPTAVTSATTGSPIGIYPITASGATAANYNISYLPGFLIVTGFPVIHRIFKSVR